MYIIFKVCLEYYLHIKFNNKKNWYSSRAPVPSKNMLKRLGLKNTTNGKTSSLVFNRKP